MPVTKSVLEREPPRNGKHIASDTLPPKEKPPVPVAKRSGCGFFIVCIFTLAILSWLAYLAYKYYGG